MRRLLLWLAIPVGCALLAWIPFVHGLDVRTVDVFLPTAHPHPDIALLAIDQRSIERIGRWPWSRETYARLFDALQSAHPRVLGIDVMFSEAADEAGDRSFARALNAATFPVILPVEETIFTDGSRKLLLPLAAFRDAASVDLGHVNVPLAPDGFARFFPGLMDGTPSFASALVKHLSADTPSMAGRMIAFAGPAGTIVTYSVADVIDGTVPADRLRDAILLMGATASDFHDTVTAPVGGSNLLSGVEWHGTVIGNILLRTSVLLVPRLWVFLWALILGMIAAVCFRLWTMREAVMVTILCAVLTIVTSALLARVGVVFPYLSTLLTLAGTALTIGMARLIVIDREKRRLRRTLKNYFSPRVMEEILTSPHADVLGAKRAEVSVFFSDIRNFTTMSESCEPELLASFMQDYFTAMSEEIHATDGVLEKFIGDAIMAFWGAPIAFPDHAERAVRTAQAMYNRFRQLRTAWEARGIFGVDIGMSVNTGSVLVGNMGSRIRFNYGILGDTVNTAARIEGLNKEFTSHLLIGKRTHELLPPDITCIDRGEVMVKGKTKPIQVFEIPIVV